MKIKLNEVNLPKELKINGDESWLKSIYDVFPAPDGETTPALSAELTISDMNDADIYVYGTLRYEPFVTCSRCAKPINWNVEEKVSALFLEKREDISGKSEKSLDEIDDIQYLIKDNSINIERVLNDTVQTAIPNRLVRYSKDGERCDICNEDFSNEQVYGKTDKTEDSPFAVLKKLQS